MIERIDPVNRKIFLDSSTVDSTIQPIDIYREMRTLRRTNEELRKYDLFATMQGAKKKSPDGSRRTERYLVLLAGTLIVPYDTSHTLTVDGTIITDTGLEGTECFYRASLSQNVEVDINYVPKQVEVITVNISGGEGASAQEIWEYQNRTLTQDVGLSEEDLHAGLDSYENKDDWKASISLLEGDLKRLINYNEGDWKIIGNQMLFYTVAGDEMLRFDLLDSNNNPTSRAVMQRLRV
jgi:hypothetical protein